MSDPFRSSVCGLLLNINKPLCYSLRPTFLSHSGRVSLFGIQDVYLKNLLKTINVKKTFCAFRLVCDRRRRLRRYFPFFVRFSASRTSRAFDKEIIYISVSQLLGPLSLLS